MRKTYIVYANSMQDAVRKVRKMRKDAVKKSRKIGDDNFYGVPGIKYISRGEWGDPEVEYKGIRFDYYDLEGPLWDEYKSEMEEEGKKADMSEFDGWVYDNKDLVYEFAENMIHSMEDSYKSRRPISKRPAIKKDSVSRNKRIVRRHR